MTRAEGVTEMGGRKTGKTVLEPGRLIVAARFPGLPPSVNNIWKIKSRGIYKSPDAKKWQADALWILRGAREDRSVAYEDEVCYLLALLPATARRFDCDNCVKSLQDCLQLAGIIKDDSQVKDHRVIALPPGGKGAQSVIYLWAGGVLPDESVREAIGRLRRGETA